MHITIIAVGAMKAGPEKDLLETYKTRLPWQVTIKEIAEPHVNSAQQRIAANAEKILAAVPKNSVMIALDEHGKSLSSKDFASQLGTWQVEGISHASFVIGGADGLGQDVLQQARMKLAFGSATWPHMLVRAMLMEQLYRAWSILENHPYHRE